VGVTDGWRRDPLDVIVSVRCLPLRLKLKRTYYSIFGQLYMSLISGATIHLSSYMYSRDTMHGTSARRRNLSSPMIA
jgi:hypothetical protein